MTRRSRRGEPRAATSRVGARASARVEEARRARRSGRRSAARGAQREARARAGLAERVEVRPRVARVDVVGRHRRDAAEVVDARREQRLGATRGSGWAAPARDTSSSRMRRAIATASVTSSSSGSGASRHRHARHGAEVLHDDLLDVAVRAVERADREQALDALAPRLADADEDAGRERDAQPPRLVDHRAGACSGRLSGARWCGIPGSHRRGLDALEHQAEADVDLLEPRHVRRRSRSPALVCGKSPRSSARAPRPVQVVDRARVAEATRACARYAENAFSGLSPRQKSASAQPSARAAREPRLDLVGRHRPLAGVAGRAAERAVVAAVAAQVGERQEDLRRVGHDARRSARRARRARRGADLAAVAPVGVGERERLLVRERRAVGGALERAVDAPASAHRRDGGRLDLVDDAHLARLRGRDTCPARGTSWPARRCSRRRPPR